jgi:hypothetical protein
MAASLRSTNSLAPQSSVAAYRIVKSKLRYPSGAPVVKPNTSQAHFGIRGDTDEMLALEREIRDSVDSP